MLYVERLIKILWLNYRLWVVIIGLSGADGNAIKAVKGKEN